MEHHAFCGQDGLGGCTCGGKTTATRNYPSQSEAAWILSLRLYGFRVLSIREGR